MKPLVFVIILGFSFQSFSQWAELSPLPGYSFFSVDFSDSLNGWVCGSSGIILYTSDGGINWSKQKSEINSNLRKIRFADLENGWAVGDSGKILHTTNGGLNWNLQNSTASLKLTMLNVIDANTAYSAGRWGASQQDILLHTSNGGITWSTLRFRFDGLNEHVSEISFIDKYTGWYCTWQYNAPFVFGAIYNTTDGGQLWNKQKSIGSLSSIFFVDKAFGASAGWNLSITENSGVSWLEVIGFINRYFSIVRFFNKKLGWLIEDTDPAPSGAQTSTIHFSEDGGYNWIKQFKTSMDFLITDFCIIGEGIGWASIANRDRQDGRLLHTTNGGVTFIEDEENNFTQPKEFLLQQNYPNPFNPSTSIQYAISSTQFVTLKVYDLLGREVATLVNEEKPAGSYNAQFTINNTQLSSGIYFYRLQVYPDKIGAGDPSASSGQGFVETKKMILLK